MVQCLVGLGSNLGDSANILNTAVEHLQTRVEVLKVSRWYSTPPIGPSSDGQLQPDFLNGVALLDSPLTAFELAKELHCMESEAGRTRTVRWSSRTLDADLLVFGDQIIHSHELTVPHPRMMTRRFVLEPAAEVAGDVVHPVMGWSMQRLFEHLRDALPFFVVFGPDQLAATALAEKLAQASEGQFVPFAELADSLLYDALPPAEDIALRELLAKGPWFTDNWGEEAGLLLAETHAAFPSLRLPKLIISMASQPADETKPQASATAGLRVPTLNLSPEENAAWQDAFGAVQGMQ